MIKINRYNLELIKKSQINWVKHKKNRFNKVLKEAGLGDGDIEFLLVGDIYDELRLEEIKLKLGSNLGNIEDKFRNYYNTFSSKCYEDDWNPITYINLLDIQVCPYCNRNFIINASNGSKRTRGELDHFIPKSIEGLYSLNINNLVPSCNICNKLKSNDELLLINPLQEGYVSDAKFTLKKKNDIGVEVPVVFYEKNVDIIIDIAVQNNNEKIINSIKTFLLKKVYQEHSNLAKETLKKLTVYTESYIDDLLNQYGGKLFNNRNEVLSMLYDFHNEEEYKDFPLSKFTADILKSCGAGKF